VLLRGIFELLEEAVVHRDPEIADRAFRRLRSGFAAFESAEAPVAGLFG
jgi:hypothetical protein